MTNKSKATDIGCTKVQYPRGRNYEQTTIPKNVMRHLEIKGANNLFWIPLSVGDEQHNLDIVVVCADENPYNLHDKVKEVLKLLEE